MDENKDIINVGDAVGVSFEYLPLIYGVVCSIPSSECNYFVIKGKEINSSSEPETIFYVQHFSWIKKIIHRGEV